MYVADLESVADYELTFLSAQNENIDLWNRRLGYITSSLFNKLFSKDLVCGVPKL